MSLCFDTQEIMYSASFDGSVKKWNLATRSVAYSFEDRSGAVSSIVAYHDILAIGLRSGVINQFDIRTSNVLESKRVHSMTVASMLVIQDNLYVASLDGSLIKKQFDSTEVMEVVHNDTSKPLLALAHHPTSLYVLAGEFEIMKLNLSTQSEMKLFVTADVPLICFTITETYMVAGAKSGQVIAWNITTGHQMFKFGEHTGQVNAVIADGDDLYSASDDKTIIKWSMSLQSRLLLLKRTSTTALGHVGPVNSLSLCNGVLFSAGSDLTTRRWNTQTGKHEDVYFGHFKSVATVLCYNGSVFSGSEDFFVLMYQPELPEIPIRRIGSTTTIKVSSSNSKRKLKQVKKTEMVNANQSVPVVGIYAAVGGALIISLLAAALYCKYYAKDTSIRRDQQTVEVPIESSFMAENENTVVNTSMGLSKHGQLEIKSSSVAQLNKIAAGGGGEVYLAKLMDPVLKRKFGEDAVQKVTFVRNMAAEEAFHQEVGIMALLSKYPYFSVIIGYTLMPLSIVMKFYPSGSLDKWLVNHNYKKAILLKIVREIGKAVDTMHSHYLAHCDLKPQNILVDVANGVPSCFLTDFGITQVLSEKIIAAKVFNVVNTRGLSVHYAAPEAFKNFRSKKYERVDFKKYDIYSFACVLLEVITRRPPWN